MSMMNPYLMFEHEARTAMEAYQRIFGGELVMNTFGEYGAEGPEADGIMHAQLTTPAGFTLMASDAPPGMPAASRDGHVSISLSGGDDAEMRGYWDGLAEGGQVTVPLEPQMWGDVFGVVIDRFGTSWMVNIDGPQQG